MPEKPPPTAVAPPPSSGRLALREGLAFGKEVLAALLKRWPKVLFVALLWGLSRVCELAEEPYQSACELLVKLANLVTP